MTFQVVIDEDFVFVAAFNHEEVMRRFPLDNDDACNDKILAHRVTADRQNLERLPKKSQGFGSWRKLFDWACDFQGEK